MRGEWEKPIYAAAPVCLPGAVQWATDSTCHARLGFTRNLEA